MEESELKARTRADPEVDPIDSEAAARVESAA